MVYLQTSYKEARPLKLAQLHLYPIAASHFAVKPNSSKSRLTIYRVIFDAVNSVISAAVNLGYSKCHFCGKDRHAGTLHCTEEDRKWCIKNGRALKVSQINDNSEQTVTNSFKLEIEKAAPC